MDNLLSRERELNHVRRPIRSKRFDPFLLVEPFGIYLQFGNQSPTNLEHIKLTNETLIVQSHLLSNLSEAIIKLGKKVNSIETQNAQFLLHDSMLVRIRTYKNNE